MSWFTDKTELDLASTLASTKLLLPTYRTREHRGSQIHHGTALLGHMAQAHLDLASKLPSSAEAFPRFPMPPTDQIDKFSTPSLFLILLPGWSSQRQSPSLLYPPQAHNSIGYCRKGFTICTRLLQIFSFFTGVGDIYGVFSSCGEKGTKNLWYPSHPAVSRTFSVSGNAQHFRGRRSEGISVQQPTFA